MNFVALIGRLTRDPEIRYTQGENAMAIARFTLAVDKNFKKKDDKANFINCVAFGKIAETVEKHVFKGSKIAVIGEWTTGSYKNKDGNTVYTNDCNISKLEFCDSKNSSGSSAEPQPKPDDSFIKKMKKVAYGANVDVAERNKEWLLANPNECPF